ncbi:MAG: hypothetical protein AMXMBFR84_28120 [Candidatus Hydrogenedentota bacterium]
MRKIIPLILAAFTPWTAIAQEENSSVSAPVSAEITDRDRQIRDRYEKALLRSPLQDQAFDRIYESYLAYEGIDPWIEKLKAESETAQPNTPHLILLGRVYARQFKNKEAIEVLEKARSQGEDRPEFKQLLGTVYYDIGNDEGAIELLSAALDATQDSDQRGKICRLLGTLYQRQGNTDQAIAAWRRLTELDQNDAFALLELAAIYEENRMWDEAIATYTHLASISQDDPYRQCRSLRSIGQSYVQQEKYTEAVATYEKALELVAPGNWLFEDIKQRLVGVYQDMGDLQGLADYVLARLAIAPGDIEMRDLLAETYTRMNRFDMAEAEYNQILERDPKRSGAYENLLALHQRQGKGEAVAATYEKLIELFPSEPDYIRRIGEFHLQSKNPDLAKTTWQRITAIDPSPEGQALLAEWYEEYDFPDEAIAAYETALQSNKNKEWSFRLAGLKFEKGDEEAAIAIWTGTLDEATSPAADYAEVAGILESFNQTEKAEPLLAKAMEKDAGNMEYALALARNQMRQERAEEALPLFEKLSALTENDYLQDQGERGLLDVYAKLDMLKQKQEEWELEVQSDATDPVRLARLGRMFERLGDRPKAISLYERCAELDPENMDHQRTLASAYRTNKQTQEAIDSYKILIEKEKDRAGGYYRELLSIYMEADLREEALATAQKVVETAPADPEARLDLAQVYQNYREMEKALEQYRYALRLEPDEPDYFRQYGDALMQDRRYGEAMEAFRKMLSVAQEDQTRRTAIVRLAGLYQQQGTIDEFIRELRERIRNTPKKLAAYEDLAAVQLNQANNAAALEALETGLEAVDDKAPALQALVRTAHDAQDLPKVVSYYEQLLAMSGKPTAQEFERLGNVYAQLGEQEKARETWNKIVEESPDDPKSYITLARAMSSAGFTEEALVAKAKAVDLDPLNIRLRFEYAQDLSRGSQTDKALEQLQLLLDAGDTKQKQEEEASKEKKVKTLQRGSGGAYRNIRYAMQGGYYSSGGRGFSGSFADFRPEIVTTMVAMADNSIGIDALLEGFKKKVEENPSNYEVRKDLVVALRAANRPEESTKEIEALLATHADDIQLLEWVAALYVQMADYQRSIDTLTRVAELQPIKRKDTLMAILPLYFQSQQLNKAKELAQIVLTEFKDDPTVVSSLLSSYQQQGLMEEAKTLRTAIETLEPRYKYSPLIQLASIHNQTGDMTEAVKIYQDVLEHGDQGQMNYGSRRQASLYVSRPEGIASMIQRYSGSRRVFSALSSAGVMRSSSSFVQTAAAELLAMPDESVSTATLAKFQASAGQFANASSTDERDRAWAMGKFLIAHHIGKSEYDLAAKALDDFHQAGMDDVEWYNLKLAIAELQNDHPAMLSLYDEVENRYPSTTREATRARIAVNIRAGDYAKAAEGMRALMQRGLPPAQIMEGINQFRTAGEKEITKSLLEEHLSGLSRNSDALSLLAELYSEEDNLDKAIELAREAWDRRIQGTARSNSYYYTSYGGVYYANMGGGPQGTDQILQRLHQYMAAAGRTPELIAEFEDRLAKQPGSIEIHRHLASLYSMNNEVDKAMEVWQKLIDKRPNYAEAKMTVAQLLTNKGRFDEALAMYEDMIKKTPSMYSRVSWSVRDLYQRMGKGEQLDEMEKTMVAKATTPDQMQELAWRFREEGDYNQAIELLEKAAKLAPTQTYYKSELAQTYVSAGRIEEALATYVAWMDSPVSRAQGWVDYYAVDQMAGLYRATGKLDELKTKNAEALQKNATDKIALAVDAGIAKLEKRFDDARAIYESLMTRGQDQNVVNQLVEMSELQADPAAVLALIEKSGQNANYWGDRLPLMYLAAGDRVKAYEEWKKYAQRYGGAYGYREVMQQLVHHGLWEEAEDYYTNNRKAAIAEEWVAREMDQIAARGYALGKGFAHAVEELKAQPIKGTSAEFLKAILNSMKDDTVRCREFLQPLLEKDPENTALLVMMADNHVREDNFEAAAPLFAKAVELDKDNGAYVQQYANCLVSLGRVEDADALFQAWYPQRLAERGPVYTTFLQQVGRWKQILTLKESALQTVDPSLKDQTILHFAGLEASMGNIEAAKSAYKELFDRSKDANSFSAYYEFLTQKALYSEAYALFMANKDEGFLDQWQGSSEAYADLCLQEGDPNAIIDHAWKFLRYGDRYNRDYYVNRIADRMGGKFNLRKFYGPLEARIFEDPNPMTPLVLACARLNSQIGNYDRAIELYKTVLDKNRFESQARQGLVGALHAQGRYEEELALTSDLSVATNTQAEVSATIELAQTYFNIQRPEDAVKTLTELYAWAKDANASQSIAQLLIEQKRYEQALPYLERASTLSRAYSGTKASLARCYAKLGRGEDAIRVAAEATEELNPESFVRWLVSEKLYDVAIAAAQKGISIDPAGEQFHIALVQAHLEMGDAANAFAALETAMQQIPDRRASDLADTVGQAIAQNPANFDAALAAVSAAPTPGAVTAMVCGFSNRASRKAKDSAQAARAAVTALPVERSVAQIKLALALIDLDDPGAALEWLRKAAGAPQLNNGELALLGTGFVDAGDPAGALAAFEKLLSRQPGAWTTQTKILVAYAKAGSPEQKQAFLDLLRANVPYEQQLACYESLFKAHEGASDESLAELAALIESPVLTEQQAAEMSNLFKENHRHDDAMRLYQRIANGGFGQSARNEALLSAVKLECETSLPEAMRYYVQLIPLGDAQATNARHAIAEKVSAESLPKLKEVILAAIAEKPAHDRGSDLVGFYSALAEKAGAADSAAAVATAAGLTGVEAEEAALWDRMVENWVVMGPFDVSETGLEGSPLDYIPELEKGLIESGVSDASSSAIVSPTDVVRAIEIDKALGLDDESRENKLAYAVTTIQSPDAREVTFSFGADDLPRVWVNGKKVFERLQGTAAVPDQERFKATLQQGVNTVVIKLVNRGADWEFFLAPLEGGDGLTASAPATATASEVASLANAE